MFRNLWFNFTSQRTFDLDEQTVFRDTICRPPEPFVDGVLHETNLVASAAICLVIKIPSNWFEDGSACSRLVATPFLFSHLFDKKLTRLLVWIITTRSSRITRGEHIFTQIQPFLATLLEVRRLKKGFDFWMNPS